MAREPDCRSARRSEKYRLDACAGCAVVIQEGTRAGVEGLIRFHTCDFRDTPLPKPPVLIAMNPEYGERMGLEERLVPLYESIGTYLKTKCQGMRAAVFTGNLALGRKIGLHPARRTAMWNGDIECRLLEYELYAGTRDARLLRKHGTGDSAPQ